MAKIKDVGIPNWIAPYFEFKYSDHPIDGIVSCLRPLQHEDGSSVKIKVFYNNNCDHPFVEFCNHPGIEDFIEQTGSLLNFKTVDGVEHFGIAIEIGLFIRHFCDKSSYITEADFFTKSVLKAINKKVRYWRNNGADYILIY